MSKNKPVSPPAALMHAADSHLGPVWDLSALCEGVATRPCLGACWSGLEGVQAPQPPPTCSTRLS